MFKAREPVPQRRHEFVSNVNGARPSATMNFYPIPSSPSDERGNRGEGILSDDHTFTSSPRAASIALSPRSPVGVEFTHTTSITPSVARRRRLNTIREGVPMPYRSATIMKQRTLPHTNTLTNAKKYQDNGGFPGPIELVNRLIQRMAPRTYIKLERTLTIPYTQTLEGGKSKWLNFDLDVGRNSNFRIDELTDDQLEEIGGVEYMALRYLSYLVPLYFIFTQVIAYLVFAPWISTTDQYDDVFDAQPRVVKKPWFALFQVMAAYTGGGLSLVDMGMVPFQNAYLMTLPLIFVILAGNHALPIFLRFIIWVGSRVSREGSDAEKAFSFLLDHPRRCFIYLFPSHQTWFLLIVLVMFSAVEWILFEVLNIGLAPYGSLNTGAKVICGLFQGLAARASGFSIVPLASLAPALQFLYMVMMYIAIYPIAISIRSTNSYEEQSLGVFDEPTEEEEEEPQDHEMEHLGVRQRVHRYVGWHLRKQVSLDIWWLVWGVFLVAIIERNNLMDEDKKWFDIFRVLFELVSAFGGIGLTLGLPYDNFSFVGGMRPLSKLVIIVIMVRGRHRGLPVAVDRAIMLPQELMKLRQQQQAEEHQKNGENGHPPQTHAHSEQPEHGLGLVFSPGHTGHGTA
ncbi:hypothetical protein PQX77_016636 [Marasmius sp. AFHP31]|nr:hypothetical protein PQX77_016636 [Marasmius sp. AFHP31]